MHASTENEEEGHMQKNGERVEQKIVVLSHFNYEIPALYIAETQAPYLPIIHLCSMLGLRADTRIPRWRKLFLWQHARKLPLQTSTGTRTVWCLHEGALLGWYSCFSWKDVLPERRDQLRHSADAWLDAAEKTYQHMQDLYKTTRRLLFEILTTYSESETTFALFSPYMHVFLDDFAVCTEWEALVAHGRKLVHDLTTLARNMLRQQDKMPLMDIVSYTTTGEVIDECSLPLLPIVQQDEVVLLYDYIEQLSVWQTQLTHILAEYGMHWDSESKKWYLG